MKIFIFKGTLHFQILLAILQDIPHEVKNLYKEFVVKILFADSPPMKFYQGHW
jgi:hypothetical protein